MKSVSKTARKKGLGKYIDRITVLTEDEEIFGVRTIRIKNGYQFKKKLLHHDYSDGQIHIAAVALFAFWHGYDRLIKGLDEYYRYSGSRDFMIHFVGEGPDIFLYKSMVQKCGLESHFKFYGMKDEEFLYDLYRKCHFGCCALGAYRKNIYYSCELKSREYLAAGLPMLTSCRLDVDEYDELKPYMILFSNDETNLDFFRIEEGYTRLYEEKTYDEIEDMRISIHDRAADILDMNAAMKQVVKYINS